MKCGEGWSAEVKHIVAKLLKSWSRMLYAIHSCTPSCMVCVCVMAIDRLCMVLLFVTAQQCATLL